MGRQRLAASAAPDGVAAGRPMERNLYRFVIRRSLRQQLALTGLVLLSTGMSVAPLELQKRIVNQAIELRDYYQQKEIARVRYEQVLSSFDPLPA